MRHQSADRLAATAAFLVGLLALLAGCDIDWVDPMRKQKKYLAYGENLLYPDGRAMRPLVETTVPRERYLGPPNIREGLINDVPIERVPVPITADLLHRGKDRYDIYCAPCHGIVGDGNSVVASKMSMRAPPSLVAGRVTQLAPGTLFRTITLGYGLMAPYATQLQIPDRWAIVAYVEALQLSQSGSLADAPPDVQKRLTEEP